MMWTFLGHGLHITRNPGSLYPHALGHVCKMTLIQNHVFNILGEVSYIFFCLISVDYHLELHVAITFYQEYHVLPK